MIWGKDFDEADGATAEALHERHPVPRVIPSLPAAAGALLYLHNPGPDKLVRRLLMPRALGSPAGSYFAAEGLNTQEERPEIAHAIKENSRLLFWASRIPEFSNLCTPMALEHRDLWSGLTLLLGPLNEQALTTWCESLGEAGFSEPASASACLILFPTANLRTRELWSRTIRDSADAGSAYEVAMWGSHTVPDPLGLIDQMRDTATTGNRGRYWFAFHRDISPDHGQQALDSDTRVDPLWAVELLSARKLSGRMFRRRMAGEFSAHLTRSRARLILRFLERGGNSK